MSMMAILLLWFAPRLGDQKGWVLMPPLYAGRATEFLRRHESPSVQLLLT